MKFYGENYAKLIKPKVKTSQVRTLADFYEILRGCWSKETAYPGAQANWTPNNPARGQCAVTAMLIYDMFGGSIHRIRLKNGETHYFNKINGHYIDLTSEQFRLYNTPISYEPNDNMDRAYCEKNSDTQQRHKILAQRVNSAINTETKDENL